MISFDLDDMKSMGGNVKEPMPEVEKSSVKKNLFKKALKNPSDEASVGSVDEIKQGITLCHQNKMKINLKLKRLLNQLKDQKNPEKK